MPKTLRLCIFTCLAISIALAAEGPPEKLPVRRVVLYKNGVGYFEHTGHIRGDQDLRIDFTSPQLNDVLKSLTVIDLNGGRITGVGYNSVAPLGEQLKSLRLSLSEEITLAGFLSALRGSRVQVRSGGALVTGRLLSVEEKAIQKVTPVQVKPAKNESSDETTEDDVVRPKPVGSRLEISVVTDSGDVRIFPVTPGLGVKIADRDLSEEISRYLNLIGSARDQDLRRMTISASGSGDRNIFVSYISEVPVWKSTYRIILPAKTDARPLLQGWAIVDNTVGEDWKDVELSLVAGAPQSFIQELSKPYYTRRPVVELPEAAMLTPQTHEGTLSSTSAGQMISLPPSEASGVSGGVIGGVAGGVVSGSISGSGAGLGSGSNFTGIVGIVLDPAGAAVSNARVRITNSAGASQSAYSDTSGAFRIPLAPGKYDVHVELQGFNSMEQKDVPVSGGSATYRQYVLKLGTVSESVEIASEAEKEEPAATGGDLGDLFEYKLKERVSILKNHSALVPIMNTHIEAEKVTLWSGEDARPLRALWIRNTSDLTLDSGTFNVMENNAFAGEGLIDPLKPRERRLLSYAADQAVRVVAKDELETRPVTHIKIANGVMIQTSELRNHQIYTIRNSDSEPRQVVIEHPVRPGWKLSKELKPDETTASFYRFLITVPGLQTKELKIDETEPLERNFALANVSDDQIKLWSSEKVMKAELNEALQRVIAMKKEIAKLDAEVATRQLDLTRIDRDQQRLRENMKALKGSAEERALLQRYTGELNAQEDRLNAIHGELDNLEKLRDQAHEQLNKTLEDIKLDEDI